MRPLGYLAAFSGKDLTRWTSRNAKISAIVSGSGFAAFCQATWVPKGRLGSEAAIEPDPRRIRRYRGSGIRVTMDRWEGIRLSWNLPDRGIWKWSGSSGRPSTGLGARAPISGRSLGRTGPDIEERILNDLLKGKTWLVRDGVTIAATITVDDR